MDLRLQNSFSTLLVGPSGCGKTRFAWQMCQNQEKMYSEKPGKIYYHYNIWQPLFNEMKEVTAFVHGLPSKEMLQEYADICPNSTVYIDDLASYMTLENLDIFTVFCHHLAINVFYIQHVLFNASNVIYRLISQSSTYTCIFSNPRDTSSFASFARQIDPLRWKDICGMYKLATSKPYGYLWLDWHQKTDPELRYRTDIFNTPENPITLYILNKK